MRTEKYSRQNAIKGWDQEKISDVKVCLVGNSILSDFILADLLSIGVNNITRIGKNNFFEFDKMNPEANLEQMNIQLLNPERAGIYIGKQDFLIDAENDIEQKYISLRYCEEHHISFISASATKECFLFSSGKSIEDLINFHAEDYQNKEEGKLNSMVCSAIVTDEFRKRLFSLEYDIKKDEFFWNGIKDRNDVLRGKRLALIGAGAAGTFAGLGLAFENANVDVIDFDLVEESNLSRQIFFYDSVGGYKAVVLAEKLEKHGGKFKGITERLDSKFIPKNYDAMISCVDSFSTRLDLSRISASYGIPLVNCGVSIYEGQVQGYIPKKTACLNCQMLGTLEGKDEKKEGSCIIQPSLIMPNQIAGGLAVEELRKIFSGEMPEIMNYSSGENIFSEIPKTKCLEIFHNDGK